MQIQNILNGLIKVVINMMFLKSPKSLSGERIYFLYQKKILFSLLSYPVFVNLSATVLFLLRRLHLPYGFFLRNNIFRLFCAGENVSDCQKVHLSLHKKSITSCFFYTCEDESSEEVYEENVKETLNTMSLVSKIENFNYNRFAVIKFTGMTSSEVLSIGRSEKAYGKFIARFDALCSKALELDVNFMVDAEESWFQNIIDEAVLLKMKEYNKKRSYIYTTIQMYRKDRLEYLKFLVEKAKKENFFVGIKLVRGAYLEKEKEYSKEKNKEDILYSSKSETDRAYAEALKYCFSNLDTVSLFAGSHNEESMDLFIKLYNNIKNPLFKEKVIASQLYGIGDYLTAKLSDNKVPVCKYVPYGPVEKALPYLLRRAQENTWTSKSAVKEKQYISKLIKDLKNSK
jgi:proline dehydrogenase